MLKPTLGAVTNWERCRIGSVIDKRLATKNEKRMLSLGLPGDQYRGYYSSYICASSAGVITPTSYQDMLNLKSKLDFRSANAIMEGCDTLVFKHYYGQSSQFDKDPNYIIYRAAGIHLYMAEIYTYYNLGSQPRKNVYGLLDDGAFEGYGTTINRTQLGVRGRVMLSTNRGAGNLTSQGIFNDDGIVDDNLVYIHDPYTNKVTGVIDYTENIKAKQEYLEDYVIKERALELAFEGERFYDLMRVAKRRNDPAYLAKKVAAKYPEGQRQMVEEYLSHEENWYIHYFE